jgi:Calcineurin-like phosphoesterase
VDCSSGKMNASLLALLIVIFKFGTNDSYFVASSFVEPSVPQSEALDLSSTFDHDESHSDFTFLDHEVADDLDNAVFPLDLYHSQQEPFRSFPCYPKLIHLAQSSNVDGDSSLLNMTVSFALDYESCPCAVPIVLFGGPIQEDGTPENRPRYTSHRQENRDFVRSAGVPAGFPWQFNYTSDKTGGLIFQSDWIYHIPIENLKGGLQAYWYHIIVTEDEKRENCRRVLRSSSPAIASQQRRSLRGSGGYYLGETKTYSFRTPPLPGQATSVALVGDLGQTMNSARTLWSIFGCTSASRFADLDAPPVSQLLIAGDLSYADSDPLRWISFLELIEPLARSLPLHVVAGNHEIECDTTTNDIFVPYEHWFRAPNQIHPAVMEPVSFEYKKTLWNRSCSAPSVFQGVYNYGNSFYSYQHGLIYAIVLNSYTNCTKGSVQYEWLEEELGKYTQNHHRRKTPWLLVAFHAPLYTTFLGHVNELEAIQMKSALEPLFLQHGVNIIVSGAFV